MILFLVKWLSRHRIFGAGAFTHLEKKTLLFLRFCNIIN